MSNRAKEHYKNNKEVLIEHARNKYRELSQKDKEIKKDMEELDIEICQKKKEKTRTILKSYYDLV